MNKNIDRHHLRSQVKIIESNAKGRTIKNIASKNNNTIGPMINNGNHNGKE
jgi:hypothetical protein